MNNLKYFIRRFIFLKTLWSPFKLFKLKWYIGKVAIGTPYFLPRKWVKCKNKPGYSKAVPKKIGLDLVGLGWKTKWSDTDYRFEWNPCLSFVFFGYQIAVIVVAPEPTHYWEAWLYYEYNTDKSLSKRERIKLCQKEFSLVWSTYKDSTKIDINYYEHVLKSKYLL